MTTKAFRAGKRAPNTVFELSDVSALSGLNGDYDGQQVSLAGWHPNSTVGGGILIFDLTRPKSDHDGVLFYSPTVPFQGATTEYFSGNGETDPAGTGVWCRLNKVVTLDNCGAVGDYDIEAGAGTDDSDAIDQFLSYLEQYTGSKTGFAASWEAQKLYSKTIKIDRSGNYLLTRSIERGSSGVIYYQNIETVNGAFIYADIPAPSATQYAIALRQLSNSNIDLAVRSKTCGAIKIDTSYNGVHSFSAGSEAGEAALKFEGVIFNCDIALRLNQNIQNSSITVSPSTYSLLADFTTPTYEIWSGMVVCKFRHIYSAGAGKGIKMLGGGIVQSPTAPGPIAGVVIESLEAEGFNGEAIEIENFNELVINGQWSEASGGASDANTMIFKNGRGFIYNSPKIGEIRDNMLLENIDSVTINNYEGGGSIKLKGNIRGLVLNQPRLKATKTRDILVADDTTVFYDLRGLSMTNPTNLNGDGSFSQISNNVLTTGALSYDSNYVIDPTGITNSTYNRCSFLSNSPSESPLLFTGQVIRLDGAGGYPWIDLDLKATTQKIRGYIIYAFRPTSPADATLLRDAGIQDGNGVTAYRGQFFGDWQIYQDGWFIGATYVEVAAGAANKARLVFNYNDFGPDGRTWDFGGAMLFAGSNIGLPL